MLAKSPRDLGVTERGWDHATHPTGWISFQKGAVTRDASLGVFE